MAKTTKFELKLRRRNIPSEDIVDDIKRVVQEIGAELIASNINREKGCFGTNAVLERSVSSWSSFFEGNSLSSS